MSHSFSLRRSSFLWGFARAILDVLNKHFQNALHISITHSALIQVTTYLGYFLMAIPAGFFINRYGYRRGVVFGLLLFGIGALLFIPGAAVGSFSAFLLCLFHYRVRFGVPGNSRQSLCYRTGCQGNSYQPTELIAVV